jgi:hypothetical protein
VSQVLTEMRNSHQVGVSLCATLCGALHSDMCGEGEGGMAGAMGVGGGKGHVTGGRRACDPVICGVYICVRLCLRLAGLA